MAFENFTVEDIATQGTTIRTLRKGAGPPLLLLHGYPQTHFIWHKIADRLSQRSQGAIGKLWDVLEVWRQHARAPVQGRALNAGHYLAEEQPEEVLQELLRFFAN